MNYRRISFLFAFIMLAVLALIGHVPNTASAAPPSWQPSCAPPAFDSLPGVYSHPPDPAWEEIMCWQQYENIREYNRGEYARIKAQCDAMTNMAARCQCYADLQTTFQAIMEYHFSIFVECIGYES